MMTEFQTKITQMAGVEFQNISEEDILTFDTMDQGHGLRGWYYLYRPNGTLKDLQCGKPLPKNLGKFTRPPLLVNLDVDEGEEIMVDSVAGTESVVSGTETVVQTEVASQVVVDAVAGSDTVEKKKAKRNISPEERARRSAHMKEVAKKYWENKRKSATVQQ